jgi:magnesium transporter
MITGFGLAGGKLTPLANTIEQYDSSAWIDLLHPTREEEEAVEKRGGLNVPTREEMQEIELSSRLYQEDGRVFMTANILSHTDSDDVVVSPVTFILAPDLLITVRYADPRSFAAFVVRASRSGLTCASPAGIAVALLEANVERLADLLERSAHDLDGLSKRIFRPDHHATANAKAKGAAKVRTADSQSLLMELGRKGDLVSHVRDSLISIHRLAAFFLTVFPDKKVSEDVADRINVLARDVESLSDHAAVESQKVNFLLDATLGMINIEQNAIIKIFSVAAVVFLPPTLVASIYGMNFDFMPELDWQVGYPFAILLMIMSAILPYLYFKRRRWL